MAAKAAKSTRGGAGVRFTGTRRTVFLDALAATSNVQAACREAEVSTQTVYRVRRMDAGFRAQWTAALCEGYAALEMAALERAIKGTVRTVKAPTGGASRVRDFSDRLTLGLLTLHRKSVEEARTAERQKALAADDLDAGGEEDPIAALIAQLDEMAARLKPGDAGEGDDDDD